MKKEGPSDKLRPWEKSAERAKLAYLREWGGSESDEAEDLQAEL